MVLTKIQKQLISMKFSDAYRELLENSYIFSFQNLRSNFPKVSSTKMYLFLMYAISQCEDVEKHIAICYYLYFVEPYIVGADSLIRWHLLQALKISPYNQEIIKNWILGIYGGNPDCPFSETELADYRKQLENS